MENLGPSLKSWPSVSGHKYFPLAFLIRSYNIRDRGTPWIIHWTWENGSFLASYGTSTAGLDNRLYLRLHLVAGIHELKASKKGVAHRHGRHDIPPPMAVKWVNRWKMGRIRDKSSSILSGWLDDTDDYGKCLPAVLFVTVRAGTAYRKIWRLDNNFFARIIRLTVQKFQLLWVIVCIIIFCHWIMAHFNFVISQHAKWGHDV